MSRRVFSVAALSLCAALTAEAQDTQKKVRWSGNFQPVQIRSSSVGMRIQSRIYGTADLENVEGNANRTQGTVALQRADRRNVIHRAVGTCCPAAADRGACRLRRSRTFPSSRWEQRSRAAR